MESDGNMFWNEVHLACYTWGHLLKKEREKTSWPEMTF